MVSRHRLDSLNTSNDLLIKKKRDQTGKFSSDGPSSTAVEPVILVPASLDPDLDPHWTRPMPASASSEPRLIPASTSSGPGPAPSIMAPAPPPQISTRGALNEFGLTHDEVMIAI